MAMRILSLTPVLILVSAGVYTSDAFTSKVPSSSCFGCRRQSPPAAQTNNAKKDSRVTAVLERAEASATALYMTTTEDHRRMGELTSPEQKTFDIMQALHDSKFNFRIVVVGHGAILETTSPLGPTMKVAQSPKTGKNLMTLASQDQSFEFHLQLADVSKIVLVQRETPKRTLRLLRFLEAEHGNSMCSLILADDSEAAQKWFDDELIGKFGTEIQL
jgi:hypothetical protein